MVVRKASSASILAAGSEQGRGLEIKIQDQLQFQITISG